MIAEHAADRFSSRAVVSLAVLCGFVVGALKCVGILTAALYVSSILPNTRAPVTPRNCEVPLSVTEGCNGR